MLPYVEASLQGAIPVLRSGALRSWRASGFAAPRGRRYKRKIRGADNRLVATQIHGDYFDGVFSHANESTRQ